MEDVRHLNDGDPQKINEIAIIEKYAMLHEIGHFFGLDHSSEDDDIMKGLGSTDTTYINYHDSNWGKIEFPRSIIN